MSDYFNISDGEKKAKVEVYDLDKPNGDDEIVTLVSADDEEIDFIDVASVEFEEEKYKILQPIELLNGMNEDEALVFSFKMQDDKEKYEIETDDGIIDLVFRFYNLFLDNRERERNKIKNAFIDSISNIYEKANKKSVKIFADKVYNVVFDYNAPFKRIYNMIEEFEKNNGVAEKNSKAEDVFSEVVRNLEDNRGNASRLYEVFFKTKNPNVFLKLVNYNRYNMTSNMYKGLLDFGRAYFGEDILKHAVFDYDA